MDSNFLQLVDNQDVSKIQSFLSNNQKLNQRLIDSSFELCCAHRENFVLLQNILFLKPSQELIDRKFKEYSSYCVYPKTLSIIQEFISTSLNSQIRREYSQTKKTNKNYYIVTDNELIRLDEIFKIFIPKRLQKIKRLTDMQHTDLYISEIVYQQECLFDLYVECILSNYNLILYELLNFSDLQLSSQNFIELVNFLFHHEKFAMLNICLSQEEGNLSRQINISQGNIDNLLNITFENFNKNQLAYLLNECPMKPSISHIREFTKKYFSFEFRWNEIENIVTHVFESKGVQKKFFGRKCQKLRKFYQGELEEMVNVLKKYYGVDELQLAMQYEERRRRHLHRLRTRNNNLQMDIHEYSATLINVEDTFDVGESSQSEPNQNTSTRKTLINTIIDYIKQKIRESNITLIEFQTIIQDIVLLIYELYDTNDKRQQAIDKLTGGINSNSKEHLIYVYTFLHYFYHDDISENSNIVNHDTKLIWIRGFLDESVLAHSCNPGVSGRIITGLRGLNNEFLNDIFFQVEGLKLLDFFISRLFNVYHYNNNELTNEKRECISNIVNYCVNNGISSSSSEDDIKSTLNKYAKELTEREFNNHSAIMRAFQEKIDVYVEALVDYWDDFIKPKILEHERII